MPCGQRVWRLSQNGLVNPPDLMSPAKYFYFSGARKMTLRAVTASIGSCLNLPPYPVFVGERVLL
jgi:hypothetical protein